MAVPLCWHCTALHLQLELTATAWVALCHMSSDPVSGVMSSAVGLHTPTCGAGYQPGESWGIPNTRRIRCSVHLHASSRHRLCTISQQPEQPLSRAQQLQWGPLPRSPKPFCCALNRRNPTARCGSHNLELPWCVPAGRCCHASALSMPATPR